MREKSESTVGSMLFLAYDLYDAVPKLLYYLLNFGQQNPHR